MTVIPFSQKPYNHQPDPVIIEGFGALPVAVNDNVDMRRFGARGGIFQGGGKPTGLVGERCNDLGIDHPDMFVGMRSSNIAGRTDEVVSVSVAKQPARHGDFIGTYSGRKFWPLDPRPEEVFIEDIAHSLSLQCRYAGHCHRFYSVAEHSVLMARHLRWEGADVALWALLHDASEAYLVDVPRPVKPYLAGYKEAEAKVMAAICERFSLPREMPPQVHEADNRIIADELANMTPMEWHAKYADPLGVRIRYWSPARAEAEFLATFEALMDCRARGME